MEIILDRLSGYLEANLPTVLSKINAKKSAADITNFGVALTLAEPAEYFVGDARNLDANLPAVRVYSEEESGSISNDSTSENTIVTVHIEVYFAGDRREVQYRMLTRYLAAIKALIKKNQYLEDITDTNRLTRQLADWSYIKSSRIGYIKELNFDAIRVTVEYSVNSEKLYWSYDIYDQV